MPDNQRLPDRLYMGYNFNISTKYGDFRASKVQNIENSVEYETFIEGGHGIRVLPKQTDAAKKLVFERGYCDEPSSLSAEKLLGVPQTDNVMSIFIYDRTHSEILKTYQVHDWMITKWKLSDLDALNGAVLLETVEVVYGELKGGDAR